MVASYDVCLSFAGEDRAYVDRVASALRARDVRVFYDKYEEAELWGRDLYQHLDDVYRNRASYCVIFVSAAYAAKLWTKRELASAQARALRENSEYVLPARLDDTDIPGLTPTIGYVDVRLKSPDELAELIARKVAGRSKLDQHAKPLAEAVNLTNSLQDKHHKGGDLETRFKGIGVQRPLRLLLLIAGLLAAILITLYLATRFESKTPSQPSHTALIGDIALVNPGGALDMVQQAVRVTVPFDKTARATMTFGPHWDGAVTIYRESGESFHAFQTKGHGFWEPQAVLLPPGKYFVVSWYHTGRSWVASEQKINEWEADRLQISNNDRDDLDRWIQTDLLLIDALRQ
jgi:hypothetical protein